MRGSCLPGRRPSHFDRKVIAQSRADPHRLGVAVQIGTVRYKGLFLEDPLAVPWPVVVGERGGPARSGRHDQGASTRRARRSAAEYGVAVTLLRRLHGVTTTPEGLEVEPGVDGFALRERRTFEPSWPRWAPIRSRSSTMSCLARRPI
ncbi:DUF4158 domain-containing protein [Nonomuraea sp. NPDC052129]|uniref:DUF4158 domain-containing protein n=1 Tax=Nonomuraea sp. NPDC052129 TaxID=3154651 RepID=UPI0034490EFE